MDDITHGGPGHRRARIGELVSTPSPRHSWGAVPIPASTPDSAAEKRAPEPSPAAGPGSPDGVPAWALLLGWVIASFAALLIAGTGVVGVIVAAAIEAAAIALLVRWSSRV